MHWCQSTRANQTIANHLVWCQLTRPSTLHVPAVTVCNASLAFLNTQVSHLVIKMNAMIIEYEELLRKIQLKNLSDETLQKLRRDQYSAQRKYIYDIAMYRPLFNPKYCNMFELSPLTILVLIVANLDVLPCRIFASLFSKSLLLVSLFCCLSW